MKGLRWWCGISLALALLPLLLVSACAAPAEPAGAAGTATHTTAQVTTQPAAPGGVASALPLGCPNPAQTPITSATRISVQPDHGPVGTRVRVVVSGARANCHLTLNLAVPPALSETNNTPQTRPGLSYPVQWAALDSTGALSLSFCVCAVIPIWASGHPQLTSVTPQPTGADVGDYAPKPGDYFFFTLGAPGISRSSAPFAAFTVTR